MQPTRPTIDPALQSVADVFQSDAQVVLAFAACLDDQENSDGKSADLRGLISRLSEQDAVRLKRLVTAERFEGNLGEVLKLPLGGDGPEMLLIAGLGGPLVVKTQSRQPPPDRSTSDRDRVVRAAASAVRSLPSRRPSRVGLWWDPQSAGGGNSVSAEGGNSVSAEGGNSVSAEGENSAFAGGEDADAAIIGLMTGSDGQDLLKTSGKRSEIDVVLVEGVAADAIERGRSIGLAINATRRLVNMPANEIYPESFCAQVQPIAEACGLEVEIWDADRLAKENCRAMLAVGRASKFPPHMLILRHRGGPDGDAPTAVVGKGVTFDSGGLSIKPSASMLDMKCDMAGAATVVGTLLAAARLKLPRNVVGVCGLAENMIAGDAYRLGDVIETRSGKTIEIHNTDAEGRVVLSDTLDVVADMKPRAIVDLATLTGACMVALGNETTGLMSNDADLQAKIQNAAAHEGEPVWPLPMFSLFDDHVKSKVADLRNVGNGRWGGAITAAKFLEPFVRELPWCHMDIAGPAFADSPEPHRDAGATGAMVRSLVRWLSEDE